MDEKDQFTEKGEKEPWKYDDSQRGSGAQPEAGESGELKREKADGMPPEETPRRDANGDAAYHSPQIPAAGGDPQHQPQSPYSPYGGGFVDPRMGRQEPPSYGDSYSNQAPGGSERYDNPYNEPRTRQPYWDNPYGGPYSPYGGGLPPVPPRKKMNTGLKIFLWVLGIVAAALLFGMIYYASVGASPSESASSSSDSKPSENASSAVVSSEPVIGIAPGDGTDPDTDGVEIQQRPSGSALSATQVYKNVIQSVVGVQTTIQGELTGQSGTSEGTGIIATADGYILTNAHVVNYSKNNIVKVILHDNKQYQAQVVGYDKTSDIAVLKINATGLSPATFGSADDMQVGDSVIAIGNPGGMSFAGSLTGGYISALDRSIATHSDNGMTYIQTDAAINPGNSGGPLLNMFSQVIGINSNKIIANGYEGMGFSIPISRAKNIINDLIALGYVSGRSRLGITGATVSDLYVQMYGLPQGVLVDEVGEDSDLNRSHVVKGDIITKADGKDITGMDELYSVLYTHKPGDVIRMTIYSANEPEGKRTREIQVRLLEDKGETQKAN